MHSRVRQFYACGLNAVIPTYRIAVLRPGCELAAGGVFVTGLFGRFPTIYRYLVFFSLLLLTGRRLLPISSGQNGTPLEKCQNSIKWEIDR